MGSSNVEKRLIGSGFTSYHGLRIGRRQCLDQSRYLIGSTCDRAIRATDLDFLGFLDVGDQNLAFAVVNLYAVVALCVLFQFHDLDFLTVGR